jgi:hypothetical protein
VIPFVASAATWLVYLWLAVVKSRGSRVDGITVLSAVLLSTVVFFRRIAGGDEPRQCVLRLGAAVVVILVVTWGDPSLMFDIHQLKGKQAIDILMERFDVDGDRAFAILRRYSRDTNTKLRDVAQQLIETRKLPG